MTGTRHPAPAATVAVAAGGTFVALLFFTSAIAQIASLSSALGAGPGAQSWILASMSVGLAAGSVGHAAPWVTSTVGARSSVSALSVLAAGGLLGVTIASPVIFVVARVVQGLGAAAVISCGLGLIAAVRPTGPDRVHATAVWGSSVGAGIAVGPILATIVDRGLDWRWPYRDPGRCSRWSWPRLTIRAGIPADRPRGRGIGRPARGRSDRGEYQSAAVRDWSSAAGAGTVDCPGCCCWRRSWHWRPSAGCSHTRRRTAAARCWIRRCCADRTSSAATDRRARDRGTGVIAAMSFAPALVCAGPGRVAGGSRVAAGSVVRHQRSGRSAGPQAAAGRHRSARSRVVGDGGGSAGV